MRLELDVSERARAQHAHKHGHTCTHARTHTPQCRRRVCVRVEEGTGARLADEHLHLPLADTDLHARHEYTVMFCYIMIMIIKLIMIIL